jgi:hypothetical protein
MTLADIIKTDCYIVCKDVEERDRVIALLPKGIEIIGRKSDLKNIRIFKEEFFMTVSNYEMWDGMQQYLASQFLTEQNPAYGC